MFLGQYISKLAENHPVREEGDNFDIHADKIRGTVYTDGSEPTLVDPFVRVCDQRF